jgi:phosphatidate cytidylyltransferase
VIFQQWAATEAQSWRLADNVRLTRAPAATELPLELVLFIFVVGAAAIALFSQTPLSQAIGNLSISAAGLLFIALPFSAVVRLHGISVLGPRLLLFPLLLVWAGDMLAYFVGRSLGRIPMAPALSPKKTWEGAMGNMIASLLVGVLFARWMQMDALTLLVIAGLGNIAGQMGDLIESAYKRGAAVKDSGTIVPGHGGVLDRIDSLILAAPVVWAAYQWLVNRTS